MRRNALLFIVLVSIALQVGASAQTFKSPPLLPTAFDPTTVATGDFNHDGNPDLIYVDGAGQGQHTLHVLLGRGDGTFAQGQNIVLPPGFCISQCTINIADISGDGLPDLIIGGGVEINPKIVVFLGNADGTFQAAIVSNLTPTPGAFSSANGLMAVGDFNGDGALDLAVGIPFGGIRILLGDKTGNFTETTPLSTSTPSTDLHAVDLNHDGHLDLLALGQFASGGFSVLFGNGDGTFQFPVLHQIGAGFKGYFADFDGDGQPDILSEFTPAFNIRQLVFIKGNPDGTFAPPLVIGQLPADFNIATVAIGDFNQDGILDLELSNHTGVGILLGQPGLTFGPTITSLSGGALFPGSLIPLVNSPAQADFNKDGHLDLAMPAAGGIVLLMGNGDGSFQSKAQVYDVGTAVTTIAVADFNGDKLPDIAVATGAPIPRLLLEQADGTFVLAADPNTTPGSGPGSLAVGDFNGDGHADLEMGPNTFNGVPTLVFGDGQGHFSAPVTVSTASPAIADFNGDGRSDMAFFNFSFGACIPGCPLVVSLGQTNNTFLTKSTLLTGIQGNVIAIGDLNGDGKQDVVLNEGGFLQVYLGNGDGTFTKGVTLDISSFTGGSGIDLSGAAIVDIDGDGRKDLVLAPLLIIGNNFFTAPQAVMILYGQGDGTFEPPALLPVSHYYTHLKVADLDQDGRPDLVLNDDVGIAVMMNLGSRKFEDESHYVAGTAIAGLAVADVNGDGFPDLVVANPAGTTVAVLLNDPHGVPLGGVHPLVSLSVSPEPSDFSAPFTASAIVSAPSVTSPAPTGNVDFFLDGTLAATVPLSSGTASFVFTATLTPGAHQVVATYSGDTTYSPASANQPHTVNRQVFATQTVLTASPLTLLASQTVHLEATVSATGGTVCPPIPSNICSWGTITFLDGGKTLHSGPTDTNGREVFDTATLGPGTHSFTAVYQGFSNSVAIFPPNTSAPVTVTVTSVPTATSASLSTASIPAGTVVTITASITSGSGTPFGGATFFDGTAPLGTVALHADGSATFSTASLAAGTHAISASFNANSTFAGSSSTPVALVVTAPPASAIATFSALSTSLHPENGSITLSAKVVATNGSPQSTVVFLDRGAILGRVTTDATGTAALTIPLPASGAHIFTASFSGDSQFAASVSPELQELWSDSGPAFSVAVNPVIMKAAAGAATGEVSVSATGPLQGPLQLSCASGLPAGYSCSFSPAALSQSGVSEVSIRRSVMSSNTAPARNTLPGSLAVVVVVMAGILIVPRRRALTGMAVLCFIGLSFLSGCGGKEQQTSQIAVVTIQAASGNGQARSVHAAQLVLMVSNR